MGNIFNYFLFLASYLVDRLLLASKMRAQCEMEFNDLCATTHPSTIHEWELLSTLLQVSANGKEVQSVYFSDVNKGKTSSSTYMYIRYSSSLVTPTLMAIRQKIQEEERQRTDITSGSDIINSKVELIDVL